MKVFAGLGNMITLVSNVLKDILPFALFVIIIIIETSGLNRMLGHKID